MPERPSYSRHMKTSVVLGQWLDRPLEADLEVAVLADELGYPELWVPEMAKADSPAMAALIAERTNQIELTLGPLPVTVRSSVQIAIALQTVALAGRPVHAAFGTSSSLVARWHDRSRRGAADRLDTTRAEVAALLDGERVNGFRLSQPPEPRPSTHRRRIRTTRRRRRRQGRPHGAQHGDRRDRRTVGRRTPEHGRLVVRRDRPHR